ncbi:MAG: ubiquinone/menaquinone biosynthesis methyltransferase [Candidatus Hydrogenedentota bacterium]
MDSRSIFRPIVPVYDLLNRLLSLGIDQSWRREAARRFSAGRVLDLACGTGDLSLALAPRCRVVGADILPEMLARAMTKKRAARFYFPLVAAAGESLPFKAASMDGVTVAFGVRNFADREAGLKEMARVIRPGGRAVILEFAMPDRKGLRSLYLSYFRGVLPFLGRVVSGDERAYSYLPESVLNFPPPAEFRREILGAGFSEVTIQDLTFGIVRLYDARR